MSILGGIILPYNPLRQVVSDIVIERVRKGLWSTDEVVVRPALEKWVKIVPNYTHHAFCHLEDSCRW